ncbi:hypothetical protein FDP41_003956 [Naegleria fowleri]|uniref:Uncharacterized protein n=1 Tax=Naegleria fowleri TaxID=5763 RepID=A0A6A5BHF5_NAEFO|nr:uncharacterized protein FDP41_003956 [Naegleria fowleri]KAF0977303.1 hypothetical protein FDP41_003956 [Naegleria fowleri]
MKRCVSLFLKIRKEWITKNGQEIGNSDEVKIVLFGVGGVGKSTLALQFIAGQFVEDFDPTIEDIYRKQIHVDGSVATVCILDLAGPEEYHALRVGFIHCSQIFVFVCAVDDHHTAHELES